MPCAGDALRRSVRIGESVANYLDTGKVTPCSISVSFKLGEIQAVAHVDDSRVAQPFDGAIAPTVEANGYFDAIVPFSKLLGLP